MTSDNPTDESTDESAFKELREELSLTGDDAAVAVEDAMEAASEATGMSEEDINDLFRD